MLWVLALGRTLLNLTLVPRLDAEARLTSAPPMVSVVIPARNESASIECTVRAFLAQDYPDLEVIVVNDRSTDDTAAVLARIDDGRLSVIEGIETPAGWLGKPWALDQGARRARGTVILFADADIFYAPQAVRAAVAELLKSGAALIGLFPRFDMEGFVENVGMGMLPFTLGVFPYWLMNLWQLPRLGLGAGSGNVVRREALERIDFFTRLRDAVVDDVWLAQTMRRNGEKTYAVRADHLIRVHMYRGAKQIVDGFTKNLFPGFGRSYAIALIFFAIYVAGNIFPFVYAFTGDVYAIGTVVLLSVLRVIVFRSTDHPLWNALFLHPLMAVFWAYIFLRSIWVTGVRRQVHWRGRVYDAHTGDIRPG